MLVIGPAPQLVVAAVERGVPVTVMARRKGVHPDGVHPDGVHPDGVHPDGVHPDGVHPDGVRVVTGDVKFAASLAQALEGESVVVSTLRGSAPVARLSLEALILGMHAAGVRRLVAVSGESDDAVRASRLDWHLVATPLAALDTLGA